MHAKSNKLYIKPSRACTVPSGLISATILHWTSILSKTFISVTQISQVPTHAETIWFLSHKLYDVKQCEFYAQIFSRHSIPYATLTCCTISFQRSRSPPPRCANTPQRHHGLPHLDSRVSSQRELYARAHQDIPYQRVKTCTSLTFFI